MIGATADDPGNANCKQRQNGLHNRPLLVRRPPMAANRPCARSAFFRPATGPARWRGATRRSFILIGCSRPCDTLERRNRIRRLRNRTSFSRRGRSLMLPFGSLRRAAAFDTRECLVLVVRSGRNPRLRPGSSHQCSNVGPTRGLVCQPRALHFSISGHWQTGHSSTGSISGRWKVTGRINRGASTRGAFPRRLFPSGHCARYTISPPTIVISGLMARISLWGTLR